MIKPIKDSLADTTDVEERTKAFARAIEAEKSAPTDSNASDPDALLISKNTGQLVTLCFGVPNVDVELGRAFAQVQNKISAQQAIPIDQGQSYNETKENKK